MYQKTYSFGGVYFRVVSETPLVLTPKMETFLTADTSAPDYTLNVMPAEDDTATDITFVRSGTDFTVYIPAGYMDSVGIRSILTVIRAANLFLEHDGFILHASYIIHEGRAILFSAPSGTGKSTQANFWETERGAEIINGDRVLITRRNGQFYANGIYAAGTSGICHNKTAPICAIVYLEQGKENELVSLPPHQMFLRLICQCTFDAESESQYNRITSLVSDLINTVSVCCYRCRFHPDSVAALERLLWNKK